MKQMKVLGVIAVALTLGLTACGGTKECKTHKWGDWEVVTAKTCTEDGLQKRVCTVCKKEETKKINKGHEFGAWTTVTPSTCTVKGSEKRVCSVCQHEETRELDLAEHTYVADTSATDVAPTCTETGTENLVCSVCGDKKVNTIPANGHTWGEWETVAEPTCDVKGSRKHKCSVCNVEESEDIDALGHDLELVGGEQQAPAGEATVRLYKCKRCNMQYLGFKADEPSAASLPHLMVGDHEGMRFFGRPIGNSLALDATGKSVNETNNECVYCSTETGDFFEYIFTLTEEQAASLATCRLYCDARPADHLSGDFWAYGRSATDWTPGYYIDGSDAHVQKNEDGTVKMVKDHARCVNASETDRSQAEGAELDKEVPMGARIEDYRYVLYVDDVIQQFDEDTKVAPKGSGTNMERAEYVLPFTFHLHKGQNKISLRMAGGYRSEFYNFVFRPYVEPTQITVNEETLTIEEGKTAKITSSMTDLTYKSSSNSVCTVDDKGVVTGVKAGTATITVSKQGNYKDAKVAVTVTEKAGVIKVEAETGTSNPESAVTFRTPSGGASGQMTDAFPVDAELTLVANNEKAAGQFALTMTARGSNITLANVMSLKLNGVDVDLTGKTVTSGYSMGDTDLGIVDLKAGENTLVIKHTAEGTMPNFDFFKFTPHVHEFGNPTTQQDEVASVIGKCSCGLEEIRWDGNKYNATESSSSIKKDQDSGVSGVKGMKLDGDVYNKGSGNNQTTPATAASEGAHVNYNINVPAAKTGVKLLIKGARNSSTAVGMFSMQDNDNSKSWYEATPGETWVRYPWRYKLFVNGVEIPFTAYTAENPEPSTGSKKLVEAAFPCTFDLKQGVNKIELQKWGGYTFIISELAFQY